MSWLIKAAQDYGWALALAAALFAIALVYAKAPAEVGLPLPGDEVIKIAPASGLEGFDVAPFCADPMTKVASFIAPDASGVTYQLTRVRDMRTEAVVVVKGIDGETRIAKHYYTAEAGQQSEDAVVTEAAWDCIARKMQ